MIERIRIGVFCGFALSLMLGCAKPGIEAQALPAHPFPRWVNELQADRTGMEEVRERFGPPDAIEMRGRGDRVWRYAFAEIEWPLEDPDRPVVSADGTIGPREPTAFERIGDGIRAAGLWIDGMIFFPPRQERSAGSRPLPATIHRLEIVFGSDGTLRRYRYRPEKGVGRVSNES